MEKVLPLELWQRCVNILQDEIQQQHFNTWLRPLKVLAGDDTLCLLAPNRFVSDWLKENYLVRIEEIIEDLSQGEAPAIALSVASKKPAFMTSKTVNNQNLLNEYRDKKTTFNNTSTMNITEKKIDLLVIKEKASTFITKCAITKSKPASVLTNQDYSTQKTLDLDFDLTNITTLKEPEYNNIQATKQNNTPINNPSTNLLTNPNSSIQIITEFENNKTIPKKNNRLNTQNTIDYPSSQSIESTLLNQETSCNTSIEKPELLSNSNAQTSSSSKPSPVLIENTKKNNSEPSFSNQDKASARKIVKNITHSSLNPIFTFENFIEGSSNQLALSAAKEIAQRSGEVYNPLFLYGGVGLGKTHLMHALGNQLLIDNKKKKVVYLSSERFVSDMIKALQLNAINDFKRYYRSVDALLIDDIQFFSRKERSQEEFFHTFNSLLEEGRQIILTCDRYPKQILGIDERLKSRFGWGLTVAIEPPKLETRIAILMKKAEQAHIDLPSDAAFFLAQRLHSNVRELEGALKRVIASAHFIGEPISVGLIQEALKDLFAIQDKLISIENIQRIVSDFYKIKQSDILSKMRTRNVSFPRQISMALAKKLTTHSLPEIGELHGGRDHTTVIHACRKVKELLINDKDFIGEFHQLLNILTT